VDLSFPEEMNDHKQAFQIGSSKGGAVNDRGSFPTGCKNSMLLACKCILPFLLLRSNPYFKSPLIGQFMAAS
jgi:hypothetical protein